MHYKHQEKWDTDGSADFHRTCLRFCHGSLRRFAWPVQSARFFRQNLQRFFGPASFWRMDASATTSRRELVPIKC